MRPIVWNGKPIARALRDATIGRARSPEFLSRARMALGARLIGKSHFGNEFRAALDLRMGNEAAGAVDPYLQSGPFKRGVDQISNALVSVPFRIFKRDGNEEEVTDHAVTRLFRSPHPYLNGKQLFSATAIHLKNDGWIVWGYQAPRPGDGVPTQIWPLNPDSLEPVTDNGGFLTGWKYRPAGARRETPFSLEQSTLFRNYNPNDPIRGLPAIVGGKKDIDQEFWAKALASDMFKRGSFLGNVFIADKGVGPEQARAIMEAIASRHGGPGKGWKDILIQSGVTLEKAGTSPKDMDFRSLLSYSREEIGGNLGVGPLLMGILEHANYANARVQERIFWTGTIIPMMEYIQDVLDSSFFARFAPELTGVFDTSNVAALKEDFKDKMECAKMLNEMGVPVSEINQLLDIGIDIDNAPWLRETLVPFSMIPARFAAGQSEPASPAASDSDANKTTKALDALDAVLPVKQIVNGDIVPDILEPEPEPDTVDILDNVTFPKSLLKTERLRTQHWKGFIQTLLAPQKALTSKMRGYFFEQQRAVLEGLLGEGRSVTALASKVKAWKRGALDGELMPSALLGVVKDKIDDILPPRGPFDDKLKKILKPFIEDGMETGAGQFLEGLGLDPFDLDDPNVITAINNRTLQVKGLINDTTDRELRAALREGFDNGESVNEIAKRVQTIFTQKTSFGARRIARTEVLAAANAGKFIAARQKGIAEHEWLSARDSAVRDSHAPGSGDDGKIVKVGDPFPVTGLLHPLDPQGDPSETIQCVLPGTLVSGRFLGALKALYSGKAIEIETRRGHRVAVTINHPVMTPKGFLSASDLREGDDVICEGRNAYGISSGRNDQEQNVPAPVEQVFDFIVRHGTTRVHNPTRFDLDGDAEFFRSKIDLAVMTSVAQSELMNKREATSGQLVYQGGLVSTDGSEKAATFASLGDGSDRGCAVLPARAGLPGCAALSDNGGPILPELSPLQELGVGSTTGLNVVPLKNSHDSRTSNGKSFREGQHALAVEEGVNDGPLVLDSAPSSASVGPAANWDLRCPEPARHDVRACTEFAGKLRRTSSGEITLDQIVKIRRFDYLGHVYDLQSVVGYFSSGGIISRNCRCTALPAQLDIG